MKRVGGLFARMVSLEHLVACSRQAARGKRHRPDVAGFLFRLEPYVLDLQRRLGAPAGA